MFTNQHIKNIEIKTRGQHTNKMWHHYQTGLLTASNFHPITHMRNSTDLKKFIRYLLSPKHTTNKNLPPALEWGCSREEIARKIFLTQHRRNHGVVKFEEMGLAMDSEHFSLGASPDGKVPLRTSTCVLHCGSSG